MQKRAEKEPTSYVCRLECPRSSLWRYATPRHWALPEAHAPTELSYPLGTPRLGSMGTVQRKLTRHLRSMRSTLLCHPLIRLCDAPTASCAARYQGDNV